MRIFENFGSTPGVAIPVVAMAGILRPGVPSLFRSWVAAAKLGAICASIQRKKKTSGALLLFLVLLRVFV
jgi:hypothetical protein